MPTRTIDAAIARIRAFAAAKGWAKSRLAVEAGLSVNALRDFDHDDWNPRIETIRQLERLIPADFEAVAEAGE